MDLAKASLSRLSDGAFVPQEPFFAPELSRVTYEGPVFADDPMAGENNRQGIAIVGKTYRSRGIGVADPLRDCPVVGRRT